MTYLVLSETLNLNSISQSDQKPSELYIVLVLASYKCKIYHSSNASSTY